MFIIDDFYYISFSLYAYWCLSLHCGGKDRISTPFSA